MQAVAEYTEFLQEPIFNVFIICPQTQRVPRGWANGNDIKIIPRTYTIVIGITFKISFKALSG